MHGLLFELYSLFVQASIGLSHVGHEILKDAGRDGVGMGSTGLGHDEGRLGEV